MSIASPVTRVTWTRGGTAVLQRTDGHYATWLSTAAAPPGTPLSGTSDQGLLLQLKVRSCRRISEEPAQYAIEGRFFNLQRAERESLVSTEEVTAL